MTPLGPDGVNARIAQIQARLDSITPRESAAPVTPGKTGTMSFGQVLDSTLPMTPTFSELSPLSGAIGSGPATTGANSKEELKAMASNVANRYGLSPDLFHAVVEQESSWNPDATSPVGAKGLCQLMPGTAADLGVTDRTDPQQSLEGGAKYLRQMLDRFGGDPAKALAAYNAGPGFVSRHSPAEWPHETKGYVRNILANAGVNT